ncbi:MAG: peptide deformylase [Clostridia bacterium]|nr:peptide deformylase [Clostridia bacterium]
MALRNVLTVDTENDSLRKRSREVDKIDEKILSLIEDMKETLYEKNGVGLAAPQIGILKRIIIIDIGEGPIVLINPVVVYQKGEVVDVEGCLSVPGVWGTVKRPQEVIVRGMTPEGETVEMSGEGLLAKAFCHEIDHLNGIIYTDKVIDYIDQSQIQQEAN